MIAAKQLLDQYSNTTKLFAFLVFKYKKVSSKQFKERLTLAPQHNKTLFKNNL